MVFASQAGPAAGMSTPLIVGFVLLAGFSLYLWRSNRASRAKAAEEQKHEVDPKAPPKTRFSDVAGCVEAVEELQEIVEFLNEPARYEKLGAKLPRGALMVGPPGTGKTLLARAVAGEAGVAFFHHVGSDFVELYVGAGAKRIRELYQKAQEAGKAIVFIDEIDAIGKKRSNGPVATGSNEEQEHTLIALLNELDGFSESGVFTIAATNRPDVLDPALTRPGRLERHIAVPAPDKVGREAILRVHGRGKPLATDVDFAAIARRTPGMSGAQLAAIVNEAAIEAARKRLDSVDQTCLEQAVANISMGRARNSAVVSEHDRRITAWHEAGHALVARLLKDAPNPAAVSIIPRGPAGGVTWMEGTDDAFMTRRAAKARLAAMLAGRAAEELLLEGECTQGAQSDLVAASDLAGAMVRQFGMTTRGLSIRTGSDSQDHASSDAVEGLLDEAMTIARTTLTRNRKLLDTIANELLVAGTLQSEDLERLIRGNKHRERTVNTKQDSRLAYSREQRVVDANRVGLLRRLVAVVRTRRPQKRRA